jgi:hypothetical protein
MIQKIVSLDERFTESTASTLIALDRTLGVPSIAQEVVRQALQRREHVLRSTGIETLSAIRDWVKQHPKTRAPKNFTNDIDEACRMIKRMNYEASAIILEESAEALVRDLDYRALSLQETALVSSFVAEMIGIAEALEALGARHLTIASRDIRADDALWRAANGKASMGDLVPLVAEVFCHCGDKLCSPNRTTLADLRNVMLEGVDYTDIPGFAVAMWAAANKQLIALNKSILETVAGLTEIEVMRTAVASSST